jgi:hypothetical protein
MKRLVKVGILSLAAAIVLFAGYSRLRAEGGKSTTIHGGTSVHPSVKVNSDVVTLSTIHNLLGTVITQGNSGAVNPAGTYTTIDSPVTVNCPYEGGCTLEVEQNVQVDSTENENLYGTIFTVDGYYNGDAPYLGETNIDGALVTGTSVGSVALTHGTHTLQSSVLSYYGLTVDVYHISYRVYAP